MGEGERGQRRRQNREGGYEPEANNGDGIFVEEYGYNDWFMTEEELFTSEERRELARTLYARRMGLPRGNELSNMPQLSAKTFASEAGMSAPACRLTANASQQTKDSALSCMTFTAR